MRRCILDVSSTARWSGPPVGIVRVEHQLAQHVLAAQKLGRWPEVVLAVYDGKRRCLREVVPMWREAVAGLDAVIDVNTLDFRWRRSFLQNLLSIRYPLVMRLQVLRLSGPGFFRKGAAWLQKRLLGQHVDAPPFTRSDGTPQLVLPVDMVLGRALGLGHDDVVLRAGSNWRYDGIDTLEMQRAFGFQLVAICYDLLPLTHPEFFPAGEHPHFKAYWQGILPVASRILCNSECIARDILALAAGQGFQVKKLDVVPLGYAAPQIAKLPALRAPLRQGCFALFVSTIEPRKGHDMLLRAWRRLLAQGVPQMREFHLVFVGRAGWMVDEVMAELNGEEIRNSVLHLQHIGDAELERLYRDCAFCVYPSQYEGFGLPIIEAFAHGKAVIASTGGAVPETAAGLSPCLPPGDDAAWAVLLREWIIDPSARSSWEQKIAEEFRYDTWPDAAERILEAAFREEKKPLFEKSDTKTSVTSEPGVGKG